MNEESARDRDSGFSESRETRSGDAVEAHEQESTQQAPFPAPEEMPGRRLREARERQSLGVDEVATRLHLQPAQVKALEDDEYGHFSAPIFVSGYLRNYARLLGLDPEPLVDAYERQGVEEPPILSELTAHMPAPRRRMSTESWAGMMIAGALVILGALWFLTRPTGELGDASPGSEAGMPPPEVAIEQGQVAVEKPSAPPAGESRPAAPDDAQGAAPRAPVAQEPGAPLDELALRFTEDSWVEIADVTGRRLMYRMGRAGQVVRLRGLAPFDILLGNAPGVTIEYNGEPYRDIPISRQNVASFRLGGNN